MNFRINLEVILLVFKCVNGLGPFYLSDLLLPYQPSRSLKSSNANLLSTPKVRIKMHGEVSFSYYGPQSWNSLPESLRAAETDDAFKKRLKIHLFNQAFN